MYSKTDPDQVHQVGPVTHGSLFENIDFVANDLLKLTNTINTCLVSPNIILYYF